MLYGTYLGSQYRDILDFAHDGILIKLQKALPAKVLEVDDL